MRYVQSRHEKVELRPHTITLSGMNACCKQNYSRISS